jgi:predicted AAA+ superfamily ATPase
MLQLDEMDKRLYPRHISNALQEALADTPVVCLLGPRQSGKTTLAQNYCPDFSYITFDDSTLLDVARRDPVGFIQGLSDHVILDEVQRAPELMPAIKASVDRNRKPGRFLLTGSANLLLLPKVQESLAGRVEVLHLYPLTELEKQRNERLLLNNFMSGTISPQINGEQSVVTGVAEAVCQGGYPESVKRPSGRARRWHTQYLNAIIQRDVKDISAIRDETEMSRLMSMLSCRTGQLLNISSLTRDLGIGRDTTEKYITILERLFLVRRLPAWHRNRAKRLIKTPKVHIVDSGLCSTLMKITPGDWNSHGQEFGPLLESFVVQQLACQASWMGDDIQFSHYRDKDQVEVDLVIEKGRDIWGVEIKKSASIHSKDGAGIARLAAQAGKAFKGGMILYCGTNTLPLENTGGLAVPMNALWS